MPNSATLRRLLGAIPTLFVIVTLAFFMIRIAPGGPFSHERPLDPDIIANLNRAYNLDKPLYAQYFQYVGSLLQGDLGPSFTRRGFSVTASSLDSKAVPPFCRAESSVFIALLI